MSRIRTFLLLLACQCVLVESTAQGAKKQRVIWSPITAPDQPSYKHFSTMDVGHATQKAIFSRLPEYYVHYRPQNYDRVFLEMQQNHNQCTDSKVKSSKRDEVANASALPQFLVSGVKAFFHSDTRKFNQRQFSKPQKLAELMQHNQQLLIGRVAGRTYSDNLDPVLARLLADGRVYDRSTEYGLLGALDLLLNKRVDLVLDYPPVVRHHLLERNLPQDTLSHLELAGEPSFKEAYIYCAKGAFAEALLQKINQVLADLARERVYLDIQLNYVVEAQKQAFISHYNTVYGSNFK